MANMTDVTHITDITTKPAEDITFGDTVVVQGHTNLVVGDVYDADRHYPLGVRIWLTYRLDGVDQYEQITVERGSRVTVLTF
jgi:hypothetical protein